MSNAANSNKNPNNCDLEAFFAPKLAQTKAAAKRAVNHANELALDAMKHAAILKERLKEQEQKFALEIGMIQL